MNRTAALLVCAMVLAGCAAPPARPDLRSFARLTPGHSSVQDAVALLGRPTAMTAIGSSMALVQWADTTSSGGYRHVGITFDPTGRMLSVQHISGF